MPLSKVKTNSIATGNITSALIASVANTAITGNIASSQITSNPTLHGNVSVTGVIGVGGATPTSNGSGITFPASQSASSDGNTLDDYEEGNWTPRNSSGTALSINNTATYIKIGKLVFINADINQLNQDSVYSLPFAVASTGYPGSVTVGYSGYASQTLNGVFNGGASSFTLYYNGNTSVAPTNGRFVLSGCYVASA